MTESLWSDTRPPLSFLYNSQHSTALLPAWRRSESQESPTRGGRVKNIVYDDPATGLRMTVTLRRFDDFPAVDWVVEFENRSQTDSPILENILPLDIAIPASRHERLSLHHAKGSLSDIDDFHPRLTELWTHNPLKLAPVGGRSSNGTLPFMNLQRHGRGGVMIAIGWSGQWAASFKRDEEALHVTAGMEKTHLLLHPGEKIRTPRILLIEYAGDDSQAGQNALRRMLMANYMPRIDGELVLPPAAGTMQAQYAADWDTWLKTNMENVELKASPIMASLGLEVQWVDACWFGNDRIWCYESGNWYVNRGRFPHGLKAVSDSAHAHGMKFILWFEPCRVYEGTTITNEHPEFVLDRTDEWYMDELLFNFGLPEARDFMIETVSKIIAEEGVDIYREDFNCDALPYWRPADAPDRIGATEIHFVVGHYEFWDELRRRFPGLWIDNCASGGRLIDLETMSRSLPLWPSDYPDIGGLRDGLAMHTGSQCIRFGLARWVPLMGGGMWNFTPYSSRSSMMAGFTTSMYVDDADMPDEKSAARPTPEDVLAIGHTFMSEKFPLDAAKTAIAEWKSVRKFFTGDMYTLLPITADTHDWCAVQFHRPDPAAGIALVFRRHKSPLTQMQLGLREIDPAANYSVSISPDHDEAPRERMTGRQLAELVITIPEKPGSLLIRYEKI